MRAKQLKLRRSKRRTVGEHDRNILVSFVLISFLAGCSVIQQVPVHPIAGRSTAELERDERECAGAVSGHDSAIAYAGCMIARGYTARVQVGPDPPVSARGWG